VPLNAEVRAALEVWLAERRRRFPEATAQALWLSRRGEPLTTRSVDLVVRRLGQEADLRLSAHTLRHTCLTNLVRNGNDLVLVAELAGHQRLETTRRYSLPSVADREAAMEALRIEY
jgi:integrase/recombinase XerC